MRPDRIPCGRIWDNLSSVFVENADPLGRRFFIVNAASTTMRVAR